MRQQKKSHFPTCYSKYFKSLCSLVGDRVLEDQEGKKKKNKKHLFGPISADICYVSERVFINDTLW